MSETRKFGLKWKPCVCRWKGKLEFSVPEAEGGAAPNLMLYLMCDSYMGADQVRTRFIGNSIEP
jgi:hypothetical protein